MRKLFTLLILVFLWTTGMTQERVASTAVSFGSFAPQSVQQNNPLAPTNVGITQGTSMSMPQGRRGEFSLTQMDNGTGIMSLSGGITCTTIGYIAGSTQTLNFTLSFTSPDLEYIDGVSLTFPTGMVPQTAGTSDPLAPENGCTDVYMDLNPITGQTVVWGQIDEPTGCGALTAGTYNFSVSVIIAPGLTGSQDISYYVMGDGYGSDPHSLSGITSIIPAVGVDVGVVSIAMGTYYNTGASITPKAIVQNFGATTQTFNVSMTLNDGVSDVYTDTKTVTSLAATASQTVSFNNWTTVTGNYTATVTTILAGDGNAANNSQNKLFAVGSMPYPAMTGNTTDLVYQSIDLNTGVRTNIGIIGSAPFPMADEYNGVAVYRVYNDYGFGIVGPDGTYSQLGTLSGVAGTPTGLAWNWATSTMYVVLLDASNLPQLCTINLNTLALTLIGTGAEGMIIGMDFANDGYIYGPSLSPDNLYRIDPATGATTSIGPLGIDINYGQDVSFDLATNQLYTISLTATGVSTFGTYSLTTGAFSGIADESGKQHATFVITNEIPDCFAPSALAVSNITTNSADLSWTPGGSEVGWLVEVGLPGFTPGNDEHVFKDSPATNSVTATGLSSGTRYQLFVQADCGSDVSAWSGRFFATNIECPGGAIVEIEACGDSTNNACNNVLPENQTSEPIAMGQTVCGTSSFDGTLRDSDWYSFTLTEAREVTLTGKADFDLQLLFVTSPCPASVIAAGTALAGNMATVVTTLSSGTYYVWVGPQFTGVFACGDDNQYYATLTDGPPSIGCGNTDLGLITPTTTSQTAAYAAGDTYFWTFNATANDTYTFSNCGAGEDTFLRIYNDEVTLVASNDDNGIYCAGTAASLDFTPSVSGLYYVSLAHYSCIALVNAYNLEYYYTPAPLCLVPTDLTATGMTTTTADLGWTEVGTATSWDIEVVEFGVTPTGVPTHPAVGTNPYTVTGLQASTHYEFYVRAKCAEDSEWSGAMDFYTECDVFSLPYFTDVTDITCWTTEFSGVDVTNRWGTSVSSNAGGSSPEFICAWQDATGMARLVSPAFNTTGMSQIKVSFRQFFNDYGLELTGCSIKLRSSSDGINWVDEGFSHFSGDGDIPAELREVTVSNNLGGTTYIAWEVDGYLYDFDYWYIDNVNIEEAAATKTLNLTSVLLEGLYIGGGNMRMADDGTGNPQFPGYADEITVELHDGAAYGTILHTATVLLSTTGSATVSDIPGALSGNYYITVKHRNSVETVSATAVSFAGGIVNQSFGAPADVYFGNLQLMVDSYYAIFAGDVNQDGIVDTGDMTDVDNDSAIYAAGYIPTDVTGDGTADTSDMTIVDNNSSNYIGTITP